MPTVFLSHAQPDSYLVMRVFEDLIRARVGDVWCYEQSSEVGADFREEYCRKVRSADFFVLFDSRHARTSPHVREEVELCRSAGGITFVPCLLEPPAAWREREIFDGQNRLVYIAFTDYEQGIKELCRCLQCTYIPRFTMPRDLDFEMEIRATAAHFSLAERQAIFNKYAFFRSMFGRNPAVAEAQLMVLIGEHFEDRHPAVVSPLLALGALRNEAKRYKDAHDAFAAATARNSGDPRGWAGRGSALFGLADYGAAAEAWSISLKRIRASGEEAHRRFEGEIRHNLASSLLESGNPGLAWERLAPAVRQERPQTEDLILAGKILNKLNDHRAEVFLKQAASKIATHEMIQSELLIDLIETLRTFSAHDLIGPLVTRAVALYPLDADILRQLAVHNAGQGNYAAAISLYRRALRLEPGNMRCLGELAMLEKTFGDHGRCSALVRECLERASPSGVDGYYVGLAHFLEGREETARYFHSTSTRSPACAGWPFYGELIGQVN